MIDERLELATALVHAVPGGALVAHDDAGRTLTVGRHPSADVDPCRWRAVVADHVSGRVQSVFGSLALAELGGSLMRAPSGGFIDRSAPERHWFAVKLPPCLVVQTLRDVDLNGLPEEAVSASVRPDPELGVTVVGVGIDAPCMVDALDSLAADVGSALAVAELCASIPIVEG
ncbi:MAG: hypothetical protein AAF081_09025 [Actinomycetota bacterium]